MMIPMACESNVNVNIVLPSGAPFPIIDQITESRTWVASRNRLRRPPIKPNHQIINILLNQTLYFVPDIRLAHKNSFSFYHFLYPTSSIHFELESCSIDRISWQPKQNRYIFSKISFISTIIPLRYRSLLYPMCLANTQYFNCGNNIRIVNKF